MIYFKPPPGLDCDDDELWVLYFALYGLPNSPLLWAEALKGALHKLGFVQSNGDPCIFYRISKGKYTLLSVVVDDLIIASKTREEANKVIKDLGKIFKVKNLGTPKYIIGVHIQYDRTRRILQLNQELYINNMASSTQTWPGDCDGKAASPTGRKKSHLELRKGIRKCRKLDVR